MSFEHQVYPELALGTIKLRGTVTARTIIESFIALYMDKRWRPGFRTLWDRREIGELIISPEDVGKILILAEVLVGVVGDGRIAVVTTRELEHNLATLFSVKGRTLPCRMESFFSITNALDWLGVEHPPAEISGG